MSLVRVALDVPLPTLFDYRLEQFTGDPVGLRVLVPFGRGQRAGMILEVGGEPQVAPERIKAVTHVFAREPRLAADVVHLMRFASRYYHHPIGQVVMGALPQGLRRARADRGERPVALTPAARAADWSTIPARAVAKRRVLDHLLANCASHPAVLRTLASTAPRALRDLIAQGWVAPETDAPLAPVAPRDPCVVRGPALTRRQTAVEAIGATLGQFAAWLLLGVTGSGKTEVYLGDRARAARRGTGPVAGAGDQPHAAARGEAGRALSWNCVGWPAQWSARGRATAPLACSQSGGAMWSAPGSQCSRRFPGSA
jgi:primosomal protein N' (replication factor Y)